MVSSVRDEGVVAWVTTGHVRIGTRGNGGYGVLEKIFGRLVDASTADDEES